MTTDLAVRRVAEYQGRVRGVYSESAAFGHTLTAHLKHMDDMVWGQSGFKAMPTWARSEVRGFEHAMWNGLYSVGVDYHSVDNRVMAPLMSVTVGPDGRLYGEDDDTWLRESAEYKADMECIHVWRFHWNRDQLRIWM